MSNWRPEVNGAVAARDCGGLALLISERVIGLGPESLSADRETRLNYAGHSEFAAKFVQILGPTRA
jgi:hypothetical protein